MSTDDITPGAERPTAGPQHTPSAGQASGEYTWSPIVGSSPYPAPAHEIPAPSAFGQPTNAYGTYGQGGWAPPVDPATTVLSTPARQQPATPAKRGRLGLVIVASALSAVIGAGAGVGTYAFTADTAPTNTVAVSSAPAAQTAVLDGTVSAAAAKITPSVVTITVEGQRASGVGTGIVLDTAGHIVTNNHVAAAGGAGAKITVTFSDDRTASATVVGTDPSSDLAVIKVDGMTGLTPAVFADSSSVKVGQAVVAVGAPLGLSDTVTSGVVSTTARPVRSGNNNDAVYLAVQTDTAINPGNSGGPLVDLNGQVVGINSSIASTSSSSQGQGQPGSIGIGFAIPAEVVTRVSQELVDHGSVSNASLGVSVAGNDSVTSATTSTGVTLASVKAGGAGAAAGLQAGDKITKVNGFETTTADGLIGAVRYYAPGTKITIDYVRDSASHTAQVTLGRS